MPNGVKNKDLDDKSIMLLRKMQRSELTEALVYRGVAAKLPAGQDKDVLLRLAKEEEAHAAVWQDYTGVAVQPNRLKAALLLLASRVFGYTFTLKLMEDGEDAAADVYTKQLKSVPQAERIAAEEREHELALLALLDEERLKYIGSMVLGLSDALVELSGTLAGLTLALRDTRLVALAGLVTGISASLSMASSEYLSSRADGHANPIKSSLYTGGIYIFTVALLVFPYLVAPRDAYFFSLVSMLVVVALVIAMFSWYISVTREESFRKRFIEMAAISFGVAGLSFVIGYFVSGWLGVEGG